MAFPRFIDGQYNKPNFPITQITRYPKQGENISKCTVISKQNVYIYM